MGNTMLSFEKLLKTLRFSALIGLALNACTIQPNHVNASEAVQPNVLLIVVDDLGWTDLGTYGSSYYETPHIDRLAMSSTRYLAAYSSSPVCSPTRAALLTGKHPSKLGITDFIPGGKFADMPLQAPKSANDHLPLEEVTIAEVFRQAGYRTFFAGKWHLGDSGQLPTDQGFDHNLGGNNRGRPPGGYYSPYKNPALQDGPAGEYLTDRLTQETIEFMQAENPAPFFAMLSYYAVHIPLEASPYHYEHFQNKVKGTPHSEQVQLAVGETTSTQLTQNNPRYASMLAAVDASVGRLINSLSEQGLIDNTIVIFTSDNGGLSTVLNGRQQPTTANVPLRAGKGWLYEGGIRVPLIVRAPRFLTPGESDVPTTTTDLFPTLLDMAGITFFNRSILDGSSLLDLADKQESGKARVLAWHFPHYHGSGWTPGAALRVGKWKLIQLYEDQRLELYDLEKDIAEQYDLAEAHPDTVSRLYEQLSEWYRETGTVIPQPAAK